MLVHFIAQIRQKLYKNLLIIKGPHQSYVMNQNESQTCKTKPFIIIYTNPFSYASVFDPTKTDTNIRVHTSVFESFSTIHTSYEKTIRFRSPWETDYRVHDVSVFENLRFRHFRPSTFSPPFSWVKVSVFHRISVDDRRKRIQKYAFSNENGLVWTGLRLLCHLKSIVEFHSNVENKCR